MGFYRRLSLFGSDRGGIYECDHISHNRIQFEVLRRVNTCDAHGGEAFGIVVGDNAADDYGNITEARFAHTVHQIFDQRDMRAR